MDIAIVTGAATSIGLAISRKLVELGCRVYGLGGNYAKTQYSHDYFVPTPCDLSNTAEVKTEVEAILEREGNIYILVNNAKLYPTKQFLDPVNLEELEMILKVNLLCPLILTRLALPSLARLGGYVINIAPTASDMAQGGPAGAASAGGLKWMAEALFEECRDTGVKVATIFAQSNRMPSPKTKPASGQNAQTIIDPDAVADAVRHIVSQTDGNIITELVLRPQRLREAPVLPPLLVPYPKPGTDHGLPKDRPQKTKRIAKKPKPQGAPSPSQSKGRRRPIRPPSSKTERKPESGPAPKRSATVAKTEAKVQPEVRRSRHRSRSPKNSRSNNERLTAAAPRSGNLSNPDDKKASPLKPRRRRPLSRAGRFTRPKP